MGGITNPEAVGASGAAVAGVWTEEQIRSAVAGANISVLRVALYHQTKDPELLAMESQEYPVRGGALTVFSVPREHHQTIRDKAIAYLLSGAPEVPPPTLEEAAHLMELYSGKRPDPVAAQYGYEELAFEDFPRDTRWNEEGARPGAEDFRVLIVGAGLSAMAAAVQLDRLGIAYDIVERHADLGGTWLINNYPEARVDVSSFVYQFKFEKNYPWSSFFAPRVELQQYANHIVDKYDIRRHIRFGTAVQGAEWDEDAKVWHVHCLCDGEQQETRTANVVISATGLFNTPRIPDIEGLDTFQGRMFHTTHWDESYDFAGKRVALIGTGSTGCQLARGVAAKADHLTIFQRTPSWVTPVEGYHAKIPTDKRWMLDNMPGYHNWFVYLNYYAELQMQKFQEMDPEWIARGGRVNEYNAKLRETLAGFIESKVGYRKDLCEKLTPNVVPMARRLVIDNEWYETCARDNVTVETGGIARITEAGIETTDGAEHAFDLIVLSTGFDVSKYVLPTRYLGRDGISLEDVWEQDGARAFKGMTVNGFPNFFMMYGPNGQARIGSFHSWAENFARYISGLMVHAIEHGKRAMVVKDEAFLRYNADMDEAMKTMLWETETGESYYVNEHGRAGVNMPWSVHEYYAMIREPDIENYEFF